MANKYLFALIFTLLILTYKLSIPNQSDGTEVVEALQAPETIINDLILGPDDFQSANSKGLIFLTEGVTLETGYLSGSFISQPIKAPNKFNAVVPQWLADFPETDEFHLEMRTGNDPSNLGSWIELHEAHDWMLPEDEDIVGDMLVVPAADATHEYIQFRLSINREDDQSKPFLHELTFTFIDSTAGPSVEEMIQQQEEINRSRKQTPDSLDEEADGYPKPAVISREVWCTDPACDYDELEYEPVTHLILHHTVSGAGGDSAAAVRAIWVFHTEGRDWDDIGYNYLVDTNGVIFEGHLGGDDVIGIHASGANAGSMALAMLGDYTEIEPPEPMFKSAVALFSWKADQKNIDVFDASNTLPNIDWGLPNLMGHRDVYGNTECPGDAAHALMPRLRDEVASRIGLVSPYFYVDELSSQFQKSAAPWLVATYQCGYNTHAWYTWSTTLPQESANWGEWRPLIPESGGYQIEVYVPYCNTGAPETEGAHYTINHSQGTSSVIINQNDRVGLWTSLGKYNLEAGNGSIIHLEDLTQTDDERGVWFDAIRLRPVEIYPEIMTEFPLNGSLLNARSADFQWKIDHPELVKATVFQVAADADFQNLIVNRAWTAPAYNTSVNFVQDYAALYWRVIATSELNIDYPSSISQFGIDTKPPVSHVTHLFWLDWLGVYQVLWEGIDAPAGIERYNIDYRIVGEGTWKRWLSDTERTSDAFTPPNPQAVYEFRSQAVDKVGNEEAMHETADITTNDASPLNQAVLVPMISRQ